MKQTNCLIWTFYRNYSITSILSSPFHSCRLESTSSLYDCNPTLYDRIGYEYDYEYNIPSTIKPTTITQPSKPKQRLAVACLFCRRRKIKCDGEAPCRHCHRRCQECVYPTEPRRRSVNKDKSNSNSNSNSNSPSQLKSIPDSNVSKSTTLAEPNHKNYL